MRWWLWCHTRHSLNTKIIKKLQLNDWFIPILGCTLKPARNFSIAYTVLHDKLKNMVMPFQSPSILWKIEHLLQKNKCSIFHNIFKYSIFQRRQKAFMWSKGLTTIVGQWCLNKQYKARSVCWKAVWSRSLISFTYYLPVGTAVR